MLKTFVDWFALAASTSVVFTYASAFGKTAAEASEAPTLDLNHTSCIVDERLGRNWTNTPPGSRLSAEFAVERGKARQQGKS